MMIAGFVLFFAARDHCSYYTSKLLEKATKFFNRFYVSSQDNKYLFAPAKSDYEEY